MLKRPGRLRNLRFELQDIEDEEQDRQYEVQIDENLQVAPENTENGENPDNTFPDNPDIDATDLDILQQPGSIKVVWPNGYVREVTGRFSLTKLMNLNSGKVLVETDENGVPNQRSAGLLGSFLGVVAKNSSYAPLHIQRWDNKLFDQPKQDLIDYVEAKFVYRAGTSDFTRDWILKVVNKMWRDYKSYLKKTYYNPNERSIDQIKKNAPPGVNEHQCVALLGIWYQDHHKRSCLRNSEAAKKQRHPHTTGRKSHTRLKREMEDKNKGPVHKIELWDEAHKKKDGNYSNQSVLQLMDKAYDKLADLKRKKNGNLSSQDYDEVFEEVIGKESTAGGYYDEKYWTTAKFYQGPSSVRQSASEVRVQNELEAMRRDLKIVTELANRMHSFIAQKYPGEDWTNEMANILDKGGNDGGQEVDDTEESMSNFQTLRNDPKQARVAYHAKSKGQLVDSSSSHEQRIQKVSKRNEQPKQPTIQEVHIAESVGNSAIQDQVKNIGVTETVGNNFKQKAFAASCTKAKEHRVTSSSANEQRNLKVSKTKKVAKQQNSDKRAVVLLSTNIRSHGLLVAQGSLVSRDSTYVVGGNMLGKDFYGVTIENVSEHGNERLPRPYGNIQTVEDAIGHCIAWPSTHVKRVKASSVRA